MVIEINSNSSKKLRIIFIYQRLLIKLEKDKTCDLVQSRIDKSCLSTAHWFSNFRR